MLFCALGSLSKLLTPDVEQYGLTGEPKVLESLFLESLADVKEYREAPGLEDFNARESYSGM